MPISEWPAHLRPREKLLSQGAGSLTDAELLAIFLRTGVRGSSAVDLAGALLSPRRFGGFRGLLRASLDEFREAPGLGEAKFAQLQAVMELARRHMAEDLARNNPLRDPGAVRRYLVAELRDRDHEIFSAVFLDNQHRVVALERLAEGTIDGASVYPREVVKRALRHGSSAVIFAHNHPSGVAEPSAADRALTERLKAALALVDIRVLDHFVVGETLVSFAERGWL